MSSCILHVGRTAHIEGNIRCEVAQDRFHHCAECTDVVTRQKSCPSPSLPNGLSFFFFFCFSPCGPRYYLLAGSLSVVVGRSWLLTHYFFSTSPQQLLRLFFFISQCPQPKLATQLPPVISNKSCRPGSHDPQYPRAGYVINVVFLPLYVRLCVWEIVVGLTWSGQSPGSTLYSQRKKKQKKKKQLMAGLCRLFHTCSAFSPSTLFVIHLHRGGQVPLKHHILFRGSSPSEPNEHTEIQ